MEFTLYYREDCHLCDAMRKAMMACIKQGFKFSWQEIDIDRDLELVRQYDTKVPVLALQNKEVCHYFFDQPALLALLDQGA